MESENRFPSLAKSEEGEKLLSLAKYTSLFNPQPDHTPGGRTRRRYDQPTPSPGPWAVPATDDIIKYFEFAHNARARAHAHTRRHTNKQTNKHCPLISRKPVRDTNTRARALRTTLCLIVCVLLFVCKKSKMYTKKNCMRMHAKR